MDEEKPDKFWKGESSETGKPEVEIPIRKSKEEIKGKINIDAVKLRNGLAQLILTVIGLLRELMEKQAIRRIEAGHLKEDEIERLGNTFMALKLELQRLQEQFSIEDEESEISLGPLMVSDDEVRGRVSAVELLDRLLGKGVIVKGDVIISVADVELISLNLGLILASIDKARELYELQ
jgi:hypothetical protein